MLCLGYPRRKQQPRNKLDVDVIVHDAFEHKYPGHRVEITPVLRYFGLQHRADRVPVGNDRNLELMEELGFDWFKEYRLRKEGNK